MIWQGGRAAENGHANLACLAFLAGLVMFGAARLIAARADAEAERLGKDNQEQEGGRE